MEHAWAPPIAGMCAFSAKERRKTAISYALPLTNHSQAVAGNSAAGLKSRLHRDILIGNTVRSPEGGGMGRPRMAVPSTRDERDMARVRDVFRGYIVVLEPFDDRWAVKLVDDTGNVVYAQTHASSREATDAAHEWLTFVGSEDEFEAHEMSEARRKLARLFNEALSRHLGSKQKRLPDERHDAMAGEDLGDWFKRQWDE
jgi:hypothetical protein